MAAEVLRPDYGPSSPDRVIAHVYSVGRMAVALAEGTCLQVSDLDGTTRAPGRRSAAALRRLMGVEMFIGSSRVCPAA